MAKEEELYDGYDEEYQCPVLDEDRVSSVIELVLKFTGIDNIMLLQKQCKILLFCTWSTTSVFVSYILDQSIRSAHFGHIVVIHMISYFRFHSAAYLIRVPWSVNVWAVKIGVYAKMSQTYLCIR